MLTATAGWMGAALVLLVMLCPRAHAKPTQYPPLPWTQVKPGISYAKVVQKTRPLVAHVLRIELKGAGTALRTVRALKKLTCDQLVKRASFAGSEVVGAINGDYFDLLSTAPMPWGLQIEQGRIVRKPTQKSVFYVDDRQQPGMAILTMSITLEPDGGEPIPVDNLNLDCRRNGLSLFNGAFGNSVSEVYGHNARYLDRLEPPMRVQAASRTAVIRHPRDRAIVAGGALIKACGKARSTLKEQLPVGRPVTVRVRVPQLPGSITEAIGGGPRIVRGGKVSIELDQENLPVALKFYLRVAHPRSAIGVDRSRRVVYFVNVEGRIKRSSGMTLVDLARFMVHVGAFDAMMFDGGGSATMIVDGKKVSAFGRRQVANAILVLQAKKP